MDERDNGKKNKVRQPEFQSWSYTNSCYTAFDSYIPKGSKSKHHILLFSVAFIEQ